MRVLAILLMASLLFGDISDDFRHFFAQQNYKKGEYKEALKIFKKLPQNSDIRFETATTLYRLKRYKEAIAYFKSIDKPELNGAINYNIANCYYKLKDYKRAKIFYKNALKFKSTKELAQKALQKVKKKVVVSSKARIKHCKGTMLGKGDLKAKIFEFSDPFVSKDLKLAKLKDEEKSNTLNSANLTTRDEKIENLELNSTKKRKKIENLSNLQEQRVDKILNKKGAKTLIIPIGESR